MSITPPEDYLYGTVVFRALKQVVDSADLGREPDVIPATGTITFTPNASYYKNLSMPATFIPDGIVGTLDAAGYMVDALGNPGIYLMDLSSPGVSPSGMTYKVNMSISGRTFPSFDITVVGGTTIDLTTVMPAATSAGAITIVTEASRIAAETARDEAVAARDDLLDGLDAAIAAYMSSHPAGLDSEAVQDLVGSLISGSGYVTATYNDGAGTLVIGSSTSLDTLLTGKAPLASPAFTGNPTAPTPTAGDNDTSIATTAFVTTGIATAIASKSDKTVSAGFRVKSGSTNLGAGPGWPLRPTGYVTVVAIGVDPSPTDSVAGDVRWIPAS